ncbi:MAG: hypothetical protein ACJA2O_004743 [Candidatus Azotimanducaceae bacterium]
MEIILSSSSHVEILKQGAVVWNKWRDDNPQIKPNLSDFDFSQGFEECFMGIAELDGYNFGDMSFNRVNMRNATFTNCFFAHCKFGFSDLCYAYFCNCCFDGANLAVSKIGSAQFINCEFNGTDLSYCSAEETNFTGSKLISAKLSHMSLVKVDFTNTIIDRSRVYGISAWDLILDGSIQSDIYIEESGTGITVPNIELAQFISLMINNSKIRDIIDTITSKVVLILGRFSPVRKEILDEIKVQLKAAGYVSVLFDFEGPTNRNVTETIRTLAGLAKFVIADISSPRSIPQELATIIPHFPSVPIQPIIVDSELEYGMFEHFKNYPWVLPRINYKEREVSSSVERAIASCEDRLKHAEPTS